jgi:hypothetical protein
MLVEAKREVGGRCQRNPVIGADGSLQPFFRWLVGGGSRDWAGTCGNSPTFPSNSSKITRSFVPKRIRVPTANCGAYRRPYLKSSEPGPAPNPRTERTVVAWRAAMP